MPSRKPRNKLIYPFSIYHSSSGLSVTRSGSGGLRILHGLLVVGFQSNIFLARHADLNQPLYSHRALPSLRYPPSLLAATFAQRADFSMRCHKRPRAVPREIAYEPPSGDHSRSKALGVCETFQTYRNRRLVHLLRFAPFRPPRYRIVPGERLTTGLGVPRGRHCQQQVFRAQQRPAFLTKSSFQRKAPHATR